MLPAQGAGFSLHLEGAQLADLIQLSCQNNKRAAFEVVSPLGVARLFFDSGQLVHATCGAEQGLNAVVAMLRWKRGEATRIACDWPSEFTVGMGADSLLLHAAQLEDEGVRRSAAPPVDCAASEPTTCVVRRFDPAEHDVARPPPLPTLPPMICENASSAVPEFPSAPRLPSVQSDPLRVAKVSSNGSVEQRSGGANSELVDRIYYSREVLSALGTTLGIGACRAAHFRGPNQSFLVCLGVSTTGVEGRCEAVHPLSKRLGVA